MYKVISLNYRVVLSLASLMATLIFLIQAIFVIKQRNIIPIEDPSYYFSYVRSFIIDNDFNFTNEYNHFNITDYNITKVGKLSNYYSIGFPLLSLPFYAITHLIILAINSIGYDLSSDGYSKIYQISFSLSGIFYGSIGLFICYKLLIKHFSDFISKVSILIILFTTNLFFYISIAPFTSEPYTFFCVSLFIFVWHKTISCKNILYLLILGLTAGLMIMVRQQNAAFLIIIFFGYISRKYSIDIRNIIKELTVFITGLFIGFSPQLIVWKNIYGNPIVYSYGEGSFIYLLEPKIAQVLFSTRHGLISWHPTIAICIIGLIISLRLYPTISTSFLISFILQLYIISSWWHWSLGYSFGNRGFIGCSLPFAFGMAFTLDLDFLKNKTRIIFLIFIIFSLWNIVICISYLSGTIPIDDYLNFSDYFHELINLPEKFIHKIKSL